MAWNRAASTKIFRSILMNWSLISKSLRVDMVLSTKVNGERLQWLSSYLKLKVKEQSGIFLVSTQPWKL
jgi:hypothetical protein